MPEVLTGTFLSPAYGHVKGRRGYGANGAYAGY